MNPAAMFLRERTQEFRLGTSFEHSFMLTPQSSFLGTKETSGPSLPPKYNTEKGKSRQRLRAAERTAKKAAKKKANNP